jgi:hypothetical protein
MSELIELLVPVGYRLAAQHELTAYQRQQGANSEMYTIGEGNGGGNVFFDNPAAAVPYLRQRGIPVESRPRDPRRPLPLFT